MKVRSFSLRGLILFMAMVVLLLPVHVFAQEPSNVHVLAKTSAPPSLFTPFTVFDPAFSYLEKGQGYISYSGNQKVSIWGETYGTVRVDKISVQLTLQRWTGSAWIDVYLGTNQQESNAAYAYQSLSNISVLSGYYYQTKSYHGILQGSTTESGYRYSASFLVP
ncbi:hypothetical protein [Paenibacillus periandrae]|uniref:hypothetical protein n=1 Tax=Paenibacillus periandrae TaxID=1761741 RepID=UPI001F09837E|nr:hypothetical protein [Paenibacillus periandrae]